jgi:hypothetical protein
MGKIGVANAPVNDNITNMTALSNGGIPLAAIANTYGVSWDESADTYVRNRFFSRTTMLSDFSRCTCYQSKQQCGDVF